MNFAVGFPIGWSEALSAHCVRTEAAFVTLPPDAYDEWLALWTRTNDHIGKDQKKFLVEALLVADDETTLATFPTAQGAGLGSKDGSFVIADSRLQAVCNADATTYSFWVACSGALRLDDLVEGLAEVTGTGEAKLRASAPKMVANLMSVGALWLDRRDDG